MSRSFCRVAAALSAILVAGSCTSLVKLAATGNTVAVRRELEKGMDPDVVDDAGFSALCAASKGGHFDTVRLLLEGGAHSNGGTCSPLYEASRGGWDDVVLLLLEYGADPDSPGTDGRQPLVAAVENRQSTIVRILLEADACPSVCYGYRFTVEEDELRNSAGDIVYFTANSLPVSGPVVVAAARSGDTESLVSLIDHGADPNQLDEEGYSALWFAVDSKNMEATRRLLLAGAAADYICEKQRESPVLLLAADRGLLAAVTLLVAGGADPGRSNADGIVPLHAAARDGAVDIASVLLEAGAQVNSLGPLGATPLILAAMNGEADMVQFLLARGADPTIKDDMGMNAAFHAMLMGHADLQLELEAAAAEH